uniref:Uncharacterized protein n=1 Tax=Arion vulgaris TaxID=1028688 RepID=A0A0B7ARC4_9EUPU
MCPSRLGVGQETNNPFLGKKYCVTEARDTFLSSGEEAKSDQSGNWFHEGGRSNQKGSLHPDD